MWWRRWHDDSDAQLDNAHLMRLAGRFARRVRASAQAHGIPVIDCKAGERKHRIAEEYLAEHPEVLFNDLAISTKATTLSTTNCR